MVAQLSSMKRSRIFSLALFLFFIFGICIGAASRSTFTCDNGLDMIVLRIVAAKTTDSSLVVLYRNEQCTDCDMQPLISINSTNSNNHSVSLDSYYSYEFRVVSSLDGIVCDRIHYAEFSECDNEYELSAQTCSIRLVRSNVSANPAVFSIGIAFAILSLVALAMISNGVEKQQRVQSIDAFRGISLFLMIFVNYGAGGYKFMQHAPWHGQTVADFIFPWFVWLMGFSLAFANTTNAKNKISKYAMLKTALARCVKLFAIGVALNARHVVSLDHLRVFGVLQRLALVYFFTALAEIGELWPHWWWWWWLTLTWLGIVKLVPAGAQCPVGYMGPGGRDQHSRFANCTGGITGHLDRLLLGHDHVYARPTCAKLFASTQPFEPEGLLGSVNAVVLACLGAQAARIWHSSSNNSSLLIARWLKWSLACGLAYLALTSGGWMPVNKNLWTLSYTAMTASSSFAILSLLYYVIDVRGVWSGAPFVALSQQSLGVYVGHTLLAHTAPCQWVLTGDVQRSHLAMLLMNLWGSVFWTLVAIVLTSVGIFIRV